MDGKKGVILMPYTTSLIDGGYEGTPVTSMTIVQLTETSVEIRIFDSANIPNEYKIRFQKKKKVELGRRDIAYNDNGSPVDYSFDAPLNNNPVITGLTAGGIYDITLYKVNGPTSTAITKENLYIMSTFSANGSFIKNPTNAQATGSSKSYFTLSNTSSEKNTFAVAQRSFDSAPAPTGFYPSSSYPKNLYYVFGTSMFMEPKEKASNQTAGMGFFLDSTSKYGWYIRVRTTATAATQDAKVFEICRADGTKIIPLSSSQKSAINRLDAVFAGRSYQIDVKVKVSYNIVDPSSGGGWLKMKIEAYVNGFKITANDEYFVKTSSINSVMNDGVAIFSEEGLAMFDYVYAKKINEEQYNSVTSDQNYYAGQFSNDLLDINFGNLFYDFNSDEDDYAKSTESVDEFGKSVREIAYVKTKFSARPSFPLSWSVGANKFAKIIASKVSNFAAEAYVLNTSSASVPLQSSNGSSFYLYGNKLSSSGQVEYLTDSSDLYSAEEPMVFTSKWIQNKNDAKNIGDWIKSKFINRGQIIGMATFGNPLLSVGDIITIKYDYEGLDGTSKFIVTSVTQNFSEGLETTIVCRSL